MLSDRLFITGDVCTRSDRSIAVSLQVVVERGAHLAGREHADDQREQQQDREREPGGGEGEAPADRQALEPLHYCARIT